jgi:Ribosomal protein S1
MELKEEKVESMADYEKEIEESFKKVRNGDMITGTVIGINDEEITLDLRYYTEGRITKNNFSNDTEINLKEAVNIGEELAATVIGRKNGVIELSRKEANDIIAWDKLINMLSERTVIKTKITGIVSAGVIVIVEGIRGFIPASKMDSVYVEDLNEWLGKTIECQVITADKEENRLVLSAKEIALEKINEENKKAVSKCSVGTILEGVVETIKEYGAFVELENGLSGLLHISQISDKRIKTPRAVIKEGEKIKVKIISIDNGKIGLSMKALIDEAAEIEEVFDYKEEREASTNLGSLLAGLKLKG